MTLIIDDGVNSIGIKGRNIARAWQPVNIIVTGSSHVVTTEMSGQISGGDESNEGIVTSAQYNRVIIKTLGFDDVIHSSGAKIYGRITEFGGVWTLNFYYLDDSGIEQVYSDFSSDEIQWWVQKVYSSITVPVYDEHFFVPTDQAAPLNQFESIELGDSTISYSDGLEFNKQTYGIPVDHGDIGSSESINFELGNTHKILLSEDATISFLNLKNGAFYSIIIEQDGTGGWDITWPAGVKFGGGELELTGDAASVDMISVHVTGSNTLLAITNDFKVA